MLRISSNVDGLTSGNRRVTRLIKGDLQPGSLALFNGESETGKSVFCQQMAYNALCNDITSVAYFTSENATDDLFGRMESFSMHVQFYFISDKLRVYPLTSLNTHPVIEESAEQLLECLRRLPPAFKLSIIDNINPILSKMDGEKITMLLRDINFFCKGSQHSVILVTNPFVFPKKSLPRITSLCDYFLQTSIVPSTIGAGFSNARLMRMLEVKKLGGIEMTNETFPFEIRERSGINLLPYMNVRA
jgi:archaeal flagellar protein FlaH